MADLDMDDAMENHPLIEEVSVGTDAMDAEQPGVIEETSTSEPKAVNDEYSGTYTWRIEHFSKSGDKVYSEKFEIGTYIWRLLIFPRGNKSQSLSVYLDAPEAAYTPLHMSPKAAFKLVITNHLDPSKSFVKDTSHTFTSHEMDWGFTQTLPLADLHAGSGFLDNDTLELRAEIQVQKDERYAYDSRKETGFVGLKNQGATCYMNSLLQYLYNLPYFRKAVYHMPVPENEEPSKSLPVALQSLFYKLQYSRTSVSTKDLTKSFGWGTYDAFMQHDVQELNRVLCEKLEEKMKGTKVEKVINEMFEGNTFNFLTCIDVDYKSDRKESFMDLQLDVKGCKDVYESFDKYTEVETLEGQNQYKTDDYGMQDAKKGILFESFPPVLQLQLKRFEYDFQRDTMVKINDRYEFPEDLDLDRDEQRYLAAGASGRATRNLYKLHSVLVHSGGVHGGHYYGYIRPEGKGWLKFDDDRVTREDEKRAVDEQFGGEDENPPPGPGVGFTNTVKFTKYSNAYMLVYVRVSDWDHIMCDVTKEDIAEHLRDRLEQEQKEKEQRQKEKAEAHLFCTLKVATDADITSQLGRTHHLDLVNHDQLPHEQCHYRVRKHTKFTDFKQQVEQRLGIPVAHQRYWIWQRRQNATYRPVRPLKPEEEALTLMDLRDHREQGAPVNKHALMDLKLYLETPLAAGQGLDEIKRGDIMVFFKYYDPLTESLSYVGRYRLHKLTKPIEVTPILCEAAGIPSDRELDFYEEVKFEPAVMVEQLNAKQTLDKASLEDGDIICIQRHLTDEEASGCRYPTVGAYLAYIRNRRLVTFKKLEEPKEAGLQLELLREMNYDDVTEALANHLQLDDAAKIRLTQHNAYSHQPQRNPVKYRAISKLEALLQHGHHTNDILYYEQLDLPLFELEMLKTLKVAFHNDKTEFVAEHQVRLPRDSTVEKLLLELSKALAPELQGKPLRLLEVIQHKIFKVIEPTETVESINDTYWQLRAEVVPDDQVVVSPVERLLHCNHVALSTDANQHAAPFGDPFMMKVREDEDLGELKKRIQVKLGVTDEEFAKWQFLYVSLRTPYPVLGDSDVLSQQFGRGPAGTPASDSNNYLGMAHEDKGPRRPPSSYRYTYEKPVKIYG